MVLPEKRRTVASSSVGRSGLQSIVAVIVDAGIGEDDDAVGLVVDHLVAVAREQTLAVAERHLDRQVVDLVAVTRVSKRSA
jgi:hypothetical protein